MAGLCPQCDEWTQIENSINDGSYKDDPEGLAVAVAAIVKLKAEAVAKGGTFTTATQVTTMDDQQRQWAEAVLSNDEASSDDALVEHFVEGGIARAEALSAVARRNEFLNQDLNNPPHLA